MGIASVASHLGEGIAMEEPASARLFDSFAHVSDPRRANARHRLFDIFVIALCAANVNVDQGRPIRPSNHDFLLVMRWCHRFSIGFRTDQ